MQPHRTPPSFLFFVIITIFISILAPKLVHTASEQFVNCDKLLQCANLHNIGYPFWGGNRPEYCGHPGFKLDCQGEAPQITIRSQTYRILGIDYSTETLRVARQDFWNNACPVYLRNTAMDSTLFRYVSDTRNLTLYYVCSQIPFLPRGAAQFNCTTNGTHSMNFYAAVNGLFNNSIGCLASVAVPVFQSAAQALEGDSSSSSLEAALDGGFGLQWSAFALIKLMNPPAQQLRMSLVCASLLGIVHLQQALNLKSIDADAISILLNNELFNKFCILAFWLLKF